MVRGRAVASGPALKKGEGKVIINEIIRVLEPLQFEQLCTKSRKASEQNEKDRIKHLRSGLLLGLSNVIKGLERGTVRLVLVDHAIEPPALLQHLLLLCATRKAPACAITGMSDSRVPHVLGVRKLAAFAFKNADVPTIYDGLVDYIIIRILPLDVPWLLSSREHGETPPAMNTAEGEDSDKHLPGMQNMERKKIRFQMQENSNGGKGFQLAYSQVGTNANENLHIGESKSAILQGAGDSSCNFSSTDEANGILPGTSASFVSLQDASTNMSLADGSPSSRGNTALNSSDISTDSKSKLQCGGNYARNSQGNPEDTQRSSGAKFNRDHGKGRRHGQPSLVYLRPFVKSYDIEKEKLSK
ncbi:Ribonuclease P protein subunit p38 [Stylophora pistillata]|uniref:Ribonuclease P protein subunit p38 n=1 Tax=Stylophora pistillata TaxID=50429 RepID=A0A2B4SUG7_STYPI|nr:Ribonuclease P protein subunit p38 [Stylophora pistillata]